MLIRTPQVSATPKVLAPPATGAAAPWRSQFLRHLSQMPMPLCAVSTVHRTDGEDEDDEYEGKRSGKGQRKAKKRVSTVDATPRVRHCVCRGLWASLPDNDKNPAPRNPAIYESDLPVFTTDARMGKAWEISSSSPHSAFYTACGSSIGGGPVEAVWWASEASTQWRVRGSAWLLGHDVDTVTGENAREAIQKHMRKVPGEVAGIGSEEKGEDWSWAREVTAHFGNLSPGMRGSFRNPWPGRPRPERGEEGNMEPGEGLGEPIDDDHLDDETAQLVFRVCVIVPDQVDQVDLSQGDDPRRWLYTYVGEDGKGKRPQGAEKAEVVNGWVKQELWP